MKYAEKLNLNEAKESTELTKADADSINKFIKSKGIKAKSVKPITITDSKFLDLDTVRIDPKSTGPLEMIYKSIEVEVKYAKAQTSGDILFVLFQFSWEHPSGSNGYTAQFMSNNGGKTWVDRNKGF